jgi:hypothetical protein
VPLINESSEKSLRGTHEGIYAYKGTPRVRIKTHASIKRKLMSIQPMFQ